MTFEETVKRLKITLEPDTEYWGIMFWNAALDAAVNIVEDHPQTDWQIAKDINSLKAEYDV